MNNKFKICFPVDDGLMLCQHRNGSWIKFQMGNKKRPPSKKGVFKKSS